MTAAAAQAAQAAQAALLARLTAWGATPTGEVWSTPTSVLAAGLLADRPVMAKHALVEEERRGGRLMAWWSDHGGLPVLDLDGDVLLMRRATGLRDLASWARGGQDPEATAAVVEVALALHATPSPPGLVPLTTWFHALTASQQEDGLLERCAGLARGLLIATAPADVVALHGDLHHGNVLDIGADWAAIDPKGLLGHRAFDFANLLLNPDEATALEHLEPRLRQVAALAGLEEAVLRDWTAAWCGLSLAWGDGEPSWHDRTARAVAERLLP